MKQMHKSLLLSSGFVVPGEVVIINNLFKAVQPAKDKCCMLYTVTCKTTLVYFVHSRMGQKYFHIVI